MAFPFFFLSFFLSFSLSFSHSLFSLSLLSFLSLSLGFHSLFSLSFLLLSILSFLSLFLFSLSFHSLFFFLALSPLSFSFTIFRSSSTRPSNDAFRSEKQMDELKGRKKMLTQVATECYTSSIGRAVYYEYILFFFRAFFLFSFFLFISIFLSFFSFFLSFSLTFFLRYRRKRGLFHCVCACEKVL